MIHNTKFPRGTIYLSGGMQFAKNLGEGWRAKTRNALQDMDYYPLDITFLDKLYSEKHGILYDDIINTTDHLQFKSNIRKHFINADLKLITNDSDAVIVYYDESAQKGAGTISEAQVAYLYDIPIFVVSKWKNWKEIMPVWLQSLSTKTFTEFDDLYSYLNDLPYGILKRDIYGNHSDGEYYLCSLSGEPFKKSKTHFVSQVKPLLSKECVEVVKKTNEEHKDRYNFFIEYIQNDINKE